MLRVVGGGVTAMHILWCCSEAVDILVQPGTQSKTFKLVVVTQPEAPVQHRRVRVHVRDALAAKFNGGKGTRLNNRSYL